MRVVIITEGVSEFKSLPKLYGQLKKRSQNALLSPLKVNVPPDAPSAVVARECKSRIKVAVAQRADLILVVLDRERQDACPGLIASSIEGAIVQLCSPSVPVRVVLKDRSYENWLVADLDALRKQPGRFRVTPAMERAVQPNKADNCNALVLLQQAVRDGQYDKVQDSVRICERVSVEVLARHSRSFRHFLHILRDTEYRHQCRNPSAGI